MSRVIVIGCGNPSRRDDSVGHYIVEEVMNAASGRIDCHLCHQLDIELADTIKDYELVIFVDAHAGKFKKELRVAGVEATYSSSAFTKTSKDAPCLLGDEFDHHATDSMSRA